MRAGVLALLLSCLLLPLTALALEPGERVAPFTLLDQRDQPYTFDDQLQVLLVARSMSGSGLVKEAMRDQPANYIDGTRVAYIADISSMPAAITRMFAVPAMRKYGYRVLLDRESRIVPRFPGAADKVLWVTLDHGRFVSQREFSDASALRDALKAKAR
ncbi:FAD/FMN-containing dehydrogenase [Pseudomonas sp. AS2.8]|uniref:FAD/FMN-containing dehydrogenase n=1 Tax=Pseudomonas sp. AS2.8 TaxID=2587128 RepID=UPI001610AB68|nr:FAD/FMN-containing dehydrogenase [Pseudomonas sp. AS2.8]MBB2898100.1 hypothetical protein [Pseudomonas sp. AS2.8]